MKITLAVRYFNKVGGMEKFTLSLADFLSRRGHKLKVIAIRGEPRQGAELITLGNPRMVPRSMRDWITGRKLALALESDDSDVIYGEQKLWNCDVLRPAGGCEDEYWKLHIGYRGPIPLPAAFRFLSVKHAFDVAAESRGYRDPRLRRIIVNSEMIRDQILAHYPRLEGRIAVVHEGIDLNAERGSAYEGREQVLARHGLDPKLKTALFVGHDFRRKGLRQAIEAVAAARRKGPDWRLQLLVVGRDRQGPYRRLARRLGLGLDVAFTGPISPADPYFRSADVLLFPTFYDPFANVTLEALAAGMPVLTTRQNGGSEVITHGQNGWVVDSPANIDALASALLELRDDSRVLGMKQRAIQAASKQSLSNKLRQIEEIFQTVADEKKRAKKAG